MEKFETGMKDLPGDQVRALPMLITGRLRADRVRQTSKYFDGLLLRIAVAYDDNNDILKL